MTTRRPIPNSRRSGLAARPARRFPWRGRPAGGPGRTAAPEGPFMPGLLRRLLPAAVWLRLRQVCLLPLELGDRLRGRREPLLPPRWLRLAAGGDFLAVG